MERADDRAHRDIMTRLWKPVFFVALLAATWGMLTPRPPVPVGPAGVDKLEHTALFAALALLAGLAYREKPRWAIVAALVIYGACIEIAQTRTGRSGEILDLVADAAGSLAVYALPHRAR